MPNINDYLQWRGDLPVCRMAPWNEIDSLAMARFAYLIFDRIEMDPEETIASLTDKMKDFTDSQFRYPGDGDLARGLGASRRFRSFRVTDYQMHNDEKAEKQFSAITVHLPSRKMYLSFLGTDDSLYGWKEDFNLSFMEHIPAQQEALEYVKEVADKYPDEKMILGGHSKGGNIAIYAGLYAPEPIQDRIEEINNYDGPGFLTSLVEENRENKVVPRIHTYIPQSSVIGRVLEGMTQPEEIHSEEKGIYQHDIYSWQVMRDHMVRVENDSNTRIVVNGMLREWLIHTTLQQREVFVDGVYEVLSATNCRTFDEFNTRLLKNMPTMLKSFSALDEEERKTIMEMITLFARTYADSFSEHVRQQVPKASARSGLRRLKPHAGKA